MSKQRILERTGMQCFPDGSHDDLIYRVSIGEATLEGFTTPQLLAWLRSSEGQNNNTLQELLKHELAKRPHIPNKEQSKAVRKAKAKAQRNR